MGLDVYLEGEKKQAECRCPCCDNAHSKVESEEFFSANITHNLNVMANAAGVYRAVWRPEELGIAKAGELIVILQEGIARLKADPEKYKQLNASNGWGTYDQFVPWLERYLAACESYPDANVSASR